MLQVFMLFLAFMVAPAQADTVQWYMSIPDICADCQRDGISGCPPMVLVGPDPMRADTIWCISFQTIDVPTCLCRMILEVEPGDSFFFWWTWRLYPPCRPTVVVESLWCWGYYPGGNDTVWSHAMSIPIASELHVADFGARIRPQEGDTGWYDILGRRANLAMPGMYFQPGGKRIIRVR